jgi:hypothetical protein
MFRRTPNSARPARRPSLGVEVLESREMLSATDWFSYYLPNPAVANLARRDYSMHHSITYGDMLGIYSQVARDGQVDDSEFSSLQALADNASALRTPDYVRYLESQVVGDNPANASFRGYDMGDLQSGSSSTQLSMLDAGRQVVPRPGPAFGVGPDVPGLRRQYLRARRPVVRGRQPGGAGRLLAAGLAGHHGLPFAEHHPRHVHQ